MSEKEITMKSRTRQSGSPSAARVKGIRLLIVDDHEAVRAGLVALLEDEPEVADIQSASSCREALAVAERMRPNLAVVDFHLPDRDGLRLTQKLKSTSDPPRVLVYSAYADQWLELAALISGADGVLGKGTLGAELCDRVKALARGRLNQFSISPETLAAAAYELDINDRPILGMLANGTPPQEIANVLRVSERWVDSRRSEMLRRLPALQHVRR
jgi:DNA-binding NarL/FixJ family response regulator